MTDHIRCAMPRRSGARVRPIGPPLDVRLTVARPVRSCAAGRAWPPIVVVAALVGCAGRPARVAAPAIDAERFAAAVVARADADGDGRLSPAESGASPGIQAAFDQYDGDKDGQLSAAEIAGRIRRWQATRVGRVSCSFLVKLDGKPLSEATVRLVPEPELAAALPEAAGRTDATGRVAPQPAGAAAGVPPGLYRVVVEHPRLASRPADAPTPGIQVAPDDPGLMSLVVELGRTGRPPVRRGP